jgi:hypothetical protein
LCLMSSHLVVINPGFKPILSSDDTNKLGILSLSLSLPNALFPVQNRVAYQSTILHTTQMFLRELLRCINT